MNSAYFINRIAVQSSIQLLCIIDQYNSEIHLIKLNSLYPFKSLEKIIFCFHSHF